jgi:hypothetical protein
MAILDPLSQAYNDWLKGGQKGMDPFTAAVRAGKPTVLPAGYNPATGSVGAAPAVPAVAPKPPATPAPVPVPQPSATAGGQVRPAAPAASALRSAPTDPGPGGTWDKPTNVTPEFLQELQAFQTSDNPMLLPQSPALRAYLAAAPRTGGGGFGSFLSDSFKNIAPVAAMIGSGVLGTVAGPALGELFGGAGELAGAASDAGLATAANASAQGGLAAALPEVAAGAAEALPGAASDAGLQSAANASAQGLPAAAAPASLPSLPATPPAASPAEIAPGPPAGTAPTAPTAPVTPTPTGGPTLGQAATAASGAAAAKTLLGGSGVSDEQLLTGQAPEAGGNQAGDVSTGFSGQGAGPDGSGVPTGLPSADGSGSGLPGLPNNASDLLKLAPAIGGLAGLATSSSNANKYFDEIKSLGGPQRDIANQLLAQYKAGTINAADAFNIQQTKQAAINKANDFYARAGIPDSTQLQGTIANINQQADAQTEQARQNLLKQGLDELNVTDNTQVEAIKAQIAGDQAAAKALTDFMTMLGTLGAKLPATQSGVATTK